MCLQCVKVDAVTVIAESVVILNMNGILTRCVNVHLERLTVIIPDAFKMESRRQRTSVPLPIWTKPFEFGRSFTST